MNTTGNYHVEMCEEMKKLRNYLDEHKIEWTDQSSEYCGLYMFRTHFKHNANTWSVINGYGSYGEKEGLLELMTTEWNDGEPEGYLTAEEVIRYLNSCN